MKTPIIRLEPVYSRPYYVEWKLHNVCNYDCSFCPSDIKDGSRRGLSLETNMRFIDKISADCGDKKVWLAFNGGEPTLYPKFIELLAYAKTKPNVYTTIYSNAGRTLRYWTELRDARVLDQLYVTYHSEQTEDYAHVADVLNLFHDEPITTIALVTHVPKYIDKAIEGYEYLLENTGALIHMNYMSIDNVPGDLNSYTAEQVEKYKKYTYLLGAKHDTKVKTTVPVIDRIGRDQMLETYSDNTKKIVSLVNLKKEGKNRFNGWTCDIGMKNMQLDVTKTSKGMCHILQGKPIDINNLEETLKFEDTPTICEFEFCHCTMDLYCAKRRTI